MIDRSRGQPALKKFFTQEFGGGLMSDFWGARAPNEVWSAAYFALRQKCLMHLLRNLEHVEKYKSLSNAWPMFAKKLRRLVGDAIRLWHRQAELLPETYVSRRKCLFARLE